MKLLKSIDNYFYTHTKKDLIYAIFGSAVLIGFVFFYFIYPSAKSFEMSNEKKYNNLFHQFDETQLQLKVFKAQEIKLKNDLKISKNNLINLKKQNSFYVELTNLLDFAKYNRQKWADYVKNLIFDANTEGMKVKQIENKLYLSKEDILKRIDLLIKNLKMKQNIAVEDTNSTQIGNSLIKKIQNIKTQIKQLQKRKKDILKLYKEGLFIKEMSIAMTLIGNYRNFLHFIYKYENQKDLLRIETIKIDLKNNYYVKFILYGYGK